jgi:hypothetical protein
MISRPAMVPAVRLEHPQVLLPADSNGAPHAMHRRTLMAIGDNPAKRRAIFFCSISFTTLGGRVLIFKPSEVVMLPASKLEDDSLPEDPVGVVSLSKIRVFPKNICLPHTVCPSERKRPDQLPAKHVPRLNQAQTHLPHSENQSATPRHTGRKGVN